MKNPIRKLYDWVLSWAETSYGTWALFVLAFVEASFFIVPAEALLIPLAIAKPKKVFKYALVCSLGSVLGGCFGYVIGWYFYDIIGSSIIDVWGLQEEFKTVGKYYTENAFLWVCIAGFTPIPYKVFTIAAGFFKINFIPFLAASVLSRSVRFFIESAILYFVGPKAKTFIDRYFNLVTVIVVLLLILGFVMLKYI